MAEKNNSLKDVIDYYDHTRFDYRVAWDNSEHPAVHFGFYDEQADNHKDALMNTNRVLAERAGIRAGEQVLDAGCGKGGSCFWLAKHRAVRATGITPVASQINDCREQLAKLELEGQVDFVQADYRRTPFQDGQFDVVWACESLCHAQEKKEFYQEAFRVLKPGGRLIIAEYIRQKRPLEAAGERLLANWLNRWAIEDIDTEAEHRRKAGEAGFENFHCDNVTLHTRTSLRNLHRNASNWLWFSKILRFLQLRSRIQHANMVGSIHQFEALEQGLWHYGILTASKPQG
ncbi:MAG: methyltransferase domain-containing protein [Bacteroidota bacterium]